MRAAPDLDGLAITEQQLKDLAPLEERLWLVRMVIDHLGQHRIGPPGAPVAALPTG